MFILKSKPKARPSGDSFYIRIDISNTDRLHVVSEYRIVLLMSEHKVKRFLIIRINRAQWSIHWADSIIFEYLKQLGYDLENIEGVTVEPDNYTFWCFNFMYNIDGSGSGGNLTSLKQVIDKFSGNKEFLFSDIEWIQEYLS